MDGRNRQRTDCEAGTCPACSSSSKDWAKGIVADEVRRHVGPEARAQEPLEELQPLSRVKLAVTVHTRVGA